MAADRSSDPRRMMMASQPPIPGDPIPGEPIPGIPNNMPIDDPVPTPTDPIPPAPSDPVIGD
jgi:hypothetical protein